MGPRTLPKHARPLAAGRWAGQPAAGRWAGQAAAGRWAGRPAVGRWAGRIAERGLARPSTDPHGLPGHPPKGAERARPRHDPLLDPLAITGHCVIGDQIRLPATCCDIPGCAAEFADLAALGEADNRARALAAGWSMDAYGRLVCPACQQRHDIAQPRIPGPEPEAGGSRTPAAVPPRPIAGSHSEVSPGRHRRAPWLHVLAALASGNNGWQAPQPVTVPRQAGPPATPAGPQAGAA